MAKIGDSYIVTLEKAHLEWGTHRYTGSRSQIYGEGYLRIPRQVACEFSLYNSNFTGGADVLGVNIFNCTSADGLFKDQLKAQGNSRRGDVYAKQFSGNNSTKYMSIFLAGGTAGFSAGPLISSFVTEKFGLEQMPILMIYGIFVGLLLVKFVPKTSDKSSLNEFIKVASRLDFFLSFFKAVKESFSVKDFRILFAISVAKCLTVSTYCVFLPFLWEKMGYSVAKIGVLIFLFVSAGAIATIVSGFFEKRIGAHKVFYLSMLTILPLTMLFILTYIHAQIISYIAVTLAGFFALLAIPINMVMAQNAVPQYRGLVSGFIGGLSWGIIGVMLPLTGFVAEKLGIPTLLLIVSLVPLICAFYVKNLKISQNT